MASHGIFARAPIAEKRGACAAKLRLQRGRRVIAERAELPQQGGPELQRRGWRQAAERAAPKLVAKHGGAKEAQLAAAAGDAAQGNLPRRVARLHAHLANGAAAARGGSG